MRSENLRERIQERTEAGVSASTITHRCLRERGYTCCVRNIKPLSEPETSEASGLKVHAVNVAFYLQIKAQESEGRLESA